MTAARCWPRTTIVFPLLALALACNRTPPVEEVSVETSGVTLDAAAAPAIATADWPGWRGPQRDGHAGEAEVVATWDRNTHILWSAPVPGRGHSSPIVVGNQVLLATALNEKQEQYVLAYDRFTGAENWRTLVHQGNFPSESQLHPKSSNANGTLASDGERVYIGFLNDDKIWVTAITLAGDIAWQKEVGPFDSKFGYAPSPLVYQSLVIVAADNRGSGYLAALDRRSGEIAWRKQRPTVSSYSSPALAEVNGRAQLLISGAQQVAGYDPATGEQLWSAPGTADATCGTVVTDGELVFASGGYPQKQTVCIRPGKEPEVVWSNRTKVYEPSLLLTDGLLFTVSDNGIAYCWEAATGEQLWRERLSGDFSASPILVGNLVYVPNLAGDTYVFKATGDGYQEVSRNKLGDDAYASLAVSGGNLFLRAGQMTDGQRQETLYCLGESLPEAAE